MYRVIIAAGVAAVILVATGCGGGGEEQATAQVSKAEFMKQAEQLCSKLQKKMQAAFLGADPNGDRWERLSSLLSREAEELNAIEGPEAVEAKVEPLTTNIEIVADVVSQKGEKGMRDPHIARFKQEAADLKLKEC